MLIAALLLSVRMSAVQRKGQLWHCRGKRNQLGWLSRVHYCLIISASDLHALWKNIMYVYTLSSFLVQPCPSPCCGRWTCTGGSTACPRRGSSGNSAMTPIWSSSEWRQLSSAAGASLATTTSTWMSTRLTCQSATRRNPTKIKSVPSTGQAVAVFKQRLHEEISFSERKCLIKWRLKAQQLWLLFSHYES